MVHELREYTLKAADWPAFRVLFETLGLPLRRNEHGVLLGSWLGEESGEEVGEASDTVRFLHLWRYDSLDARAALRTRLAAVPRWRTEYRPQAAARVQAQHLSVLLPQGGPALPLDAGRGAQGRVLHLHRYRCAVGQAAALMAGLAETEADSLGLWSTEFPDPNGVVLLAPPTQAPLGHCARSVQSVQSLRLAALGHAGALSSS
jgi:hypothetical protein